MLNKLTRSLFRLAGFVNTVRVLSSGKPDRIVKHFLRKQLFKEIGKRTR